MRLLLSLLSSPPPSSLSPPSHSHFNRVILIGSTDDQGCEGMSIDIRSVFTYEISLPAPSVKERKSLLSRSLSSLASSFPSPPLTLFYFPLLISESRSIRCRDGLSLTCGHIGSRHACARSGNRRVPLATLTKGCASAVSRHRCSSSSVTFFSAKDSLRLICVTWCHGFCINSPRGVERHWRISETKKGNNRYYSAAPSVSGPFCVGNETAIRRPSLRTPRCVSVVVCGCVGVDVSV